MKKTQRIRIDLGIIAGTRGGVGAGLMQNCTPPPFLFSLRLVSACMGARLAKQKQRFCCLSFLISFFSNREACTTTWPCTTSTWLASSRVRRSPRCTARGAARSVSGREEGKRFVARALSQRELSRCWLVGWWRWVLAVSATRGYVSVVVGCASVCSMVRRCCGCGPALNQR